MGNYLWNKKIGTTEAYRMRWKVKMQIKPERIHDYM